MFTCHIDQQYLMERSSFLLSSPDPSLFFPLSPPTFDHDSLHELLVTSSHLLPSNGAPPSDHTSGNQTTGTITAPPTRVFSGSRVKRTHRKDRHSKIVTAKGARDRRMRLSLDVARKFFDLQDTLGFDKASKTVDWLLTRSEAAIKDLTRCFSGFNSVSAKSESSTSECEVVSLGLVDSERSLVFATVQGTETGEVTATPKAKMVMTRAFRKSVTHPTLAKQLRILARARARERTREKMIRRQEQFASSSSHFETTVEESASQDMKSSVEFMAEVEQPIPPHSPNRCERTTAHQRADETLSIMAMNVVPGLMSLSDCDQNFIHNGDYLNFLQEQWNMLLS